jgi:hypothetical protein
MDDRTTLCAERKAIEPRLDQRSAPEAFDAIEDPVAILTHYRDDGEGPHRAMARLKELYQRR